MHIHITVFTFLLATSAYGQGQKQVSFDSNHNGLNLAFDWAMKKALSFAHDGSDPVGYWYEAALPNREAFCMRDVSHQAIGAEIAGLHEHNFNMFYKFAQNISMEKDLCSYWEINRYNLPAPVDFQNDRDFWYNLPANFDLIYNAHRLYRWTGNRAYIEDDVFKKFYRLSLNEYVDHWDLGYDEVTDRKRDMHLRSGKEKTNSRFGNKRGIPTYNEGGRGETVLGVDMSASLIAAYKAYASILLSSGEADEGHKYLQNAKIEQQFLDEFWWDEAQQRYRSIQYADNTFDYFMVGKDQAFLHYLLYFDVVEDQQRIERLVNDYITNYPRLIVELKSYLPIVFYEYGRTDIGNAMVIDLCSPENKRRDYPENSFTIIEDITRGLMGIDVDADSYTVFTRSRLNGKDDWAEIKDVPLLSNRVTVKHTGAIKTQFTNQTGSTIKWTAQFPGHHKFLYVDGTKTKGITESYRGQEFSSCSMDVKTGDAAVISTLK